MSGGPAPLRFLGLVLGGWLCARAAILVPDWAVETLAAAPVPPVAVARPSGEPAERQPQALVLALQTVALPQGQPKRISQAVTPLALPNDFRRPDDPEYVRPASRAAPFVAPPGLSPPGQRAARWSGSAWLFGRGKGPNGLAPSGTLGGSQAGARLTYRINGDLSRPLALSARLYAPLDRPQGAEAAVGLDWKPVGSLPLHLLAERRQALGSEGRSDFSLTVYGGVSERPVPGGLRLDAYAQAGVVGVRSRDLFVDGSARLSLPLGRAVSVGAGVWGAAQPGASRLDAGPQASLRLPVASANVRLLADWRFRIAGEARPASGPTLTLATDF